MIYSILESAKASNHNPLHYMTAVLAEIPNAKSLEDIEALLPWQLSVKQAANLYHSQPSPAQKIPPLNYCTRKVQVGDGCVPVLDV